MSRLAPPRSLTPPAPHLAPPPRTGWRRLAEIVVRLGPLVGAALRQRRRWILVGGPRSEPWAVHEARAARWRQALADLGPTFVKLAQMLATRADIVPEPYRSALAQLQDEAPPLPLGTAEAVLRAEFGRSLDALFERFDATPLAAASLAQVHRARVSGREVVVKILRPGVEEQIAADLALSFRLLWLASLLSRSHHVRALAAVVGEFARRVRDELDLRCEADNLERFRRHFAGYPRIRFPEALPAFTRRRVLVLEYVRGTRIDRLQDRFARGELRFDDLADTVAEAYVRMVAVDGFLHADPHPGNLLVDDAGRLVFLDFGMAVDLPPTVRERLLQAALAAVRGDADGVLAAMYALGMIDPEVTRADVQDAVAQVLAVLARARELGPRKIQQTIQELLDVFYRWPLVLPESLVYLLRAAALLEGIGYLYDPRFDTLATLRRVLERLRPRLTAGATRAPVRALVGQAETTLRAAADLVRRAEREELRLRLHPQDIARWERTVVLATRRLLLGLFAAVLALVSALVYVASGAELVLLAGGAIALACFFVVLVMPQHLLDNPWRLARQLRRSLLDHDVRLP